MKKIILAASLLAPLALGSAAFAQETGSFSNVVADQVAAPAPREFTQRHTAMPRPAQAPAQSGYQAQWPQGNGFGN